jgi:hypothetical protein
MAKYLERFQGVFREVLALVASAGAGDAGKIVALDGTGRLDPSVMPVGIGADTQVVQATEALAAGDWVNIYNVTGNARCRKADATVAGKQADGFVLAAVANAANATIYMEGTNTGVTGQTPGPVYLHTTPGLGVTGPGPAGAGNISQQIGVATSATTVNFSRSQPVTLA